MYGLLLHHNCCMFSILCIVCIPDSCTHVMTSYYMYIRLVCCALASALCIDLSRTNSILTAPVRGHYSGDEAGIVFRMATLPFGKLEEFDPGVGPFTAYLERVEIFSAANGIAEEKKVPIFLNTIGATVYSTLRDLLAPASPISASFADITKVLKAHYEPKSLVIVERFHFHKREQSAGESIAEYIAELRRLAAKCAFAGYLDEALRGRFVCGLRSEATQKKLLTESDLTIAKAVEIALNSEAAHKNAQAMKTIPVPVVGQVAPEEYDLGDTNTVQHGRSKTDMSTPPQRASSNRVCYRCGSTAHSSYECSHRETTCHKCGKLGHLV